MGKGGYDICSGVCTVASSPTVSVTSCMERVCASSCPVQHMQLGQGAVYSHFPVCFPTQKAQGLGIQKVRVQLKGLGKGRQVRRSVTQLTVFTVCSHH